MGTLEGTAGAEYPVISEGAIPRINGGVGVEASMSISLGILCADSPLVAIERQASIAESDVCKSESFSFKSSSCADMMIVSSADT